MESGVARSLRLSVRHMSVKAPTETQALHIRGEVALGTPAYMAPEQWIDGASAGPAVDVYALGVMAQRGVERAAATGIAPFGQSVSQLL